MKKLFVIMMFFLIAGCSTAAQMQSKRIKNDFNLASQKLELCKKNIKDNSDYSLILPHLLSEPKLKQLQDSTYPSKKEINIISQYQDAKAACFSTFSQEIINVTPNIAQIVSEFIVNDNKIKIQLIKHKITWGEAAQQSQRLEIDTQKAIINEQQRLDSQMQVLHQSELLRRSAAINSYLSQPKKQPTTINTDCYRLGNSLQCSSREF